MLGVGLLALAPLAVAAQPELPVINGRPAVATVNDDPITLEEFKRAITAAHEDRSENMKAGRIDYTVIMNRLINTRLILLEARNMGLDQLPEIQDLLAEFRQQTLMKVLIEQHVAGLTADEAAVDRIYRDLVREWKINSILFEKQADVEKARAEIISGGNFETIARESALSGKAQVSEVAEYLKNKDLTPAVARIVAGMQVGTVSPIVSVGKKGFIIFKLEGSRIPSEEVPEARKKARRIALREKKAQAARDYYGELKEKYVRLNRQLFDELDYESEDPGLDKLLKDRRVLAEIKGGQPVTVAELSNAMEKHYYHGIERAIMQKEVNAKKEKILEDILQDRILVKEALKQGIEKTDVFKDRVKQYEYSTIFGAFINRVVRPDIQMSGDELKSYYRDNLETYTTPEMVKVKSLVFDDRTMAIDALGKLNKGTDFNWLSSQIQGRKAEDTQAALNLDGKLIAVRSMPEALQKALSGAKPGEYRFYGTPDGPFYVLYVYHVVAPEPMPFAQVQKDIAEEVYNLKVKQTVESWVDKLREYYPVKVYLSDLASLKN
jgi:hypothetical protein